MIQIPGCSPGILLLQPGRDDHLKCVFNSVIRKWKTKQNSVQVAYLIRNFFYFFYQQKLFMVNFVCRFASSLFKLKKNVLHLEEFFHYRSKVA